MGSLTREFCAHVLRLAGDTLPEEVRSAGRRTLLNVVGTAVGAANHPGTTLLVRQGQEHGDRPTCPVPGRPERLGAMQAGLAAGFAAHVDDFDDTHLRTVIHPGAATMAAALPVGLERGATGANLITAFVLGVEAQLRVGVAMSPWHYDDGWHITGTCGPIGAAVAAGVLANLDLERFTNAVAIAASQTLGMREGFGTMMKAFHPGKAAANGILAVLLAERGFTGPHDVFEDPRGYFSVLSPNGSEPARILDGLGQRWELHGNTCKPYPCEIVTHPSIDAGIEVHRRIADVGAIADVEARVHPLVPELTGNSEPVDGLQARFSTPHGIAAAIVDGRAGLAQYTDERVSADDVRSVRRRVRLVVDGDCAADAARLRVSLASGETVEADVPHARGSLDRPLDDGELEDKVRALVEPVLPQRTDRLLAAFDALDAAADVVPLLAAVQGNEDEVMR